MGCKVGWGRVGTRWYLNSWFIMWFYLSKFVIQWWFQREWLSFYMLNNLEVSPLDKYNFLGGEILTKTLPTWSSAFFLSILDLLNVCLTKHNQFNVAFFACAIKHRKKSVESHARNSIFRKFKSIPQQIFIIQTACTLCFPWVALLQTKFFWNINTQK